MESWVRSKRYDFPDPPNDEIVLDIEAPKGQVATLNSIWFSSSVQPFETKMLVDGRVVDWDMENNVIYAVIQSPWPPYLLKGKRIQLKITVSARCTVFVRAMGLYLTPEEARHVETTFVEGNHA